MSTKQTKKALSMVETDHTEVVPKPTRRKFSLEYKLRIVKEANACTKPGEIGALLRREGLYSTNLNQWRRRFKEAGQRALAPKIRGRKPNPTLALRHENDKLKRDMARLEHKLLQANMIIDVQKKVSVLLGISLQDDQEDCEP